MPKALLRTSAADCRSKALRARHDVEQHFFYMAARYYDQALDRLERAMRAVEAATRYERDPGGRES